MENKKLEIITPKTPKELCSTYREELRRLYGNKIADESRIYYGHGWYYINVAKEYPDGSIGCIGPAHAYRKNRVVAMIHNLRHSRNKR